MHPKRNKIDSMFPVVANNQIKGYKIHPTQVYSMISSLNNSGILLDQSINQDKNSVSQHKPSNSVSNTIPFKGTKFSGMNTAMVNYIKDLDYAVMSENSSKNDKSTYEQINTGKIGKKKSLILTQKNTKRRSVERDSLRSKHKRSQSDGNRIMSSKGRRKDGSKSPTNQSAYYNKMIATFSNTGNVPNKNLRKTMNKTKQLHNPNSSVISKKSNKDYNSKKKIKSYYDPSYKSSDNRQKSSNIRSVPLSLMSSFEKNKQNEKTLKKRIKNSQIQNTKKVSNQVFYNKGKVNVSGQHLKFVKPKSKSNMSHHSENPSHHFSKSLAFSGDTTPISPLRQDSGKNSLRIGPKNQKVYQMMPSPFPKSSGSGISYDQINYAAYYPPGLYPRPETNVNVYDEDISILSSHDNTKHHSFYHDISGSLVSQTYENPRKKNVKRDTLQGYSYCTGDQNKKHKIIMDKKTKMSKISEIMGTKELVKKSVKKDKNYTKKNVKGSNPGK